MSSDEKPAFAPVGEMLEPLEPVVPDQPRRRSALAPIAELARLREAVTALADDDALELETAVEEALERAHGGSHYECCFNESVFAGTVASALRPLLRSLLDKPCLDVETPEEARP